MLCGGCIGFVVHGQSGTCDGDARGKGNIREMLSVPIQQLSRAHRLAPQVFTQEEQQALDTYICDRADERL